MPHSGVRERGLVRALLQLELYDAPLVKLDFLCLRSACSAASMAMGSTARSSSRVIASSGRRPPNVKHRAAPTAGWGDHTGTPLRHPTPYIRDHEAPPASSTAQHSREQRPATAPGFAPSTLP